VDTQDKPIVLVTGAAGDVGSALIEALAPDYRVVDLDREGLQASIPLIAVDLGSQDSVRQALAVFRARYGAAIASVIHLAAYFDFSGEDHPLYRSVNVEGTRWLLRALRDFQVEQFVYSGTMLVHAPATPGHRIDETSPIAPKWAYPRSKAEAEAVIREEHGAIPIVLLHLAGVYDEQRCVPTLAQQIARIYERDFKSYLYAGNPDAGQSLLHKEDMVDAFKRAVDRRHELPPEAVILIGEPDAMGYDELQDEIGRLVHGEAEWTTLRVPKPAARLGALVQEKIEPLVPDAIDQGEKPFIRPFMVEMADDHYALDISRARRLLGWEPRHRIRNKLPALIDALKRDPLGWYRANRITPPPWMRAAGVEGEHPDALRRRHESALRAQHAEHLWAHFFNIGVGAWLMTGAPMLAPGSRAMVVSDIVSGAALIVFATLSLSWRLAWARWVCAATGLWVMFAPLVFWAPTAAGYLNDTLAGMLAIGFAVLAPPEPGVSPVAATGGPEAPAGWSFNPSSWTQRLPIIALAFVGLQISRYLAAYQLGHVSGVWEPFFAGGPDPKNGTEEIITSSVSQAWPVPDAGLGAYTYALEILTGVIGSQRRWRTMPWLVLLFGVMIVPLGVVSIFFIIIQPIWIGTWCTLCLIAAAAMLVQIPYSLDELVATTQFLWRRRKAGQSLLRVLMVGDTDEGRARTEPRAFERTPGQVLRDMWSGAVNLPWNLALAILLGVWLMCTRLTLDAQGTAANAHHLIGSLVVTVSVIACAEVARTLRFGVSVLGLALVVVAFTVDGTGLQLVASLVCGGALVVLGLPRGAVRSRYADWDRCIV
jgi:nucleoside-diphosphate-sugar epimerase